MVKSICCTIMRTKVKIPAPIKQGGHDTPLILVESRGGNEDCRGLAYNLTKNTSPLFTERPRTRQSDRGRHRKPFSGLHMCTQALVPAHKNYLHFNKHISGLEDGAELFPPVEDLALVPSIHMATHKHLQPEF